MSITSARLGIMGNNFDRPFFGHNCVINLGRANGVQGIDFNSDLYVGQACTTVRGSDR